MRYVSIPNILAQPVTTGPYSTWTEDAQVNEVMHRRLIHGVSIASFPDETVRRSRLVEMLEGNVINSEHNSKLLQRGMQSENF